MDAELKTTKRMQPVPFQPMDQKALGNFLKHVARPEDPEGCWLWQAANTAKGYGRFKMKGKLYSPHRLSYAQFNGEIGAGLYVCHKCDNGTCVNPAHLFLGTCSDNMKDCRDKGRLTALDPAWIEQQRLLNAGDVERVMGLVAAGLTQSQIAAECGVSRRTIGKFFERYEIHAPSQRGKRPGRRAGLN